MRFRGVWVAAIVAVAAAGAGGAAAALESGTAPPSHATTTADSHPDGSNPMIPATTTPRGTAPLATTLPNVAPGTSTTGAGPGATTEVAANCDGPAGSPRMLSVDPATIVIACADGGIGLQDLRWTTWGAASATGTGTLWLNLCTPDCAEGTIAHYRADVTLSHVAGTAWGPAFSQASLTYPGAAPTDASGQVLAQFSLWYP